MFKKEFYKFKEVYFVFLAIIACFLIYSAFSFKNFVNQNDGVMLNLSFLYEKGFTLSRLDDLNIIFALIIGVLVFLKERVNARLRLSLHFPNSTFKNISYIVFIGLGCVCFAYFLEYIFLNKILLSFYHEEFVNVVKFTIAQSFFFGITLYLLCAGIIIEPVKKRVVINLILGLAFLFLYSEIALDIYQMPSFYHNKFGFCYIAVAFIYAICALIIAFYNYKKGYIK